MDLYQEEILEHYRHPQNYGELKNADIVRKELNPTCGDTLTFYLILDEANTVKNVAFSGEGCAISQASASMLTEEIRGKSLEEIKALSKEAVLDLIGIELGPTRLKCALLSLQGLTNAAHSHNA